jgi:hypothetical protein
MPSIRQSVGTHTSPKPRPRQVDRETHQALATLLARSIAYANANRPSAANDAAHHLVRVLRAHGIDPT